MLSIVTDRNHVFVLSCLLTSVLYQLISDISVYAHSLLCVYFSMAV